jgi:hypothetical protein
MDGTTRFLIFAVCVVLLVAYVVWRWRRAGAYVAAREQFQQRGQDNFLRLKVHPTFSAMRPLLEQRYGATFDAPSGPERYYIAWLALLDERATCYRAEDAERATMLVAYLARETEPRQLMVSMNLRTGELHETVPPYGWVFQAPDY